MRHGGGHLDEPLGWQTPEGLATKAARRAFIRSFVEHASRQLFWVLLIVILGVMVLRWFGWIAGGWWMFLAVACLWSIVAGLIHAWFNRLSMWEAAGLIDDRLGLESAVRSAIELRNDERALGESAGLVAIAIQRGKTVAAKANLDVVFEPMPKRSWYSLTAAVGALGIVGLWMPSMNRDQQPELHVPSAVIAKLDSIDDVLGDQAEHDRLPESVSPAVQEAIDELDALKEELAQGVEDESEAQAQAAAKLEELADTMDDDLDALQSEEQELSDRIAQAQNRHMDDEFGDVPDDGWEQIDDFAEAIKEQDYPEAQEKLQELMDRLDEMSDEQRQEISEAMDELAEEIDPESSESHESEFDSDSETSESDTVKQGPAEKLSESLKDQAEDIRERTQESEDRSEQGGQENQEPQPQPESESESQTEGDHTQEQGETGEPRETESANGAEEKQGEQDQGEKQGQGEQSLQETLEEMQDRQRQYNRQREQAEEIRERANDLIEESESRGVGESDSEEEGEPGGSFEFNGESDSMQGGPFVQKPMDEKGRENETGSGDTSEYESVDASAKGRELNDLGEPIGEWYSPDEQPGEISPSRASTTAKRLRNATSEAQRAIEEQQVPRKYQRIVREAFERMNRRASELEKSAESKTKIAPQGKDANSKSAQPKGDE